MKIKKKLTRKQFLTQDDGFMVFIKNAVSWIKNNRNQLIIGILGVGILTTVVWGVRYKGEAKIRNSSRLLFDAFQNFDARLENDESMNTDLLKSERQFKTKEEKYTAASESFDKILELYPSSSVVEDALFLKAEALYQLEKYDDAKSVYEEYLEKFGKKGVYSIQAHTSIGYIYEEKEDYSKAVDSFEKVISNYPDYVLRDTIFIELGRCYEETNQWDKAKENYQKIVMNFSDSPVLQDAQNKLETLSSASSQNEEQPKE